jgi:hypothetical protein
VQAVSGYYALAESSMPRTCVVKSRISAELILPILQHPYEMLPLSRVVSFALVGATLFGLTMRALLQ